AVPPTSRSRYSPFYQPSSDATSAPAPLRSLDDLLDRKRTLDAEAETRRVLPLSDDGARERALAEGDALLEEGRWIDAKKRFEKGLRSFPNDETLRERFALARRRGELELRYQDATFVELTDGASLDDVLAVFDETTLNIDNYHVDRPTPATLFAFGFAGLVEAFAHEPFYEQNGLPFERSERAEALLAKVRDASKRWRIETDADLKSAVLWLAKRLREETGVRETATISEFLCAAVCSLDAYSAHLTPVQVEDVFSMIDGRFVGIGVELKTDDPARVVRVVPNSPASESGVEAGDEIVAVDGEPTDGLTGTEIGALLQGEVGQRATLTLRSPVDGTLRRVVAVRRQIDVPSVEDVRLLDAPGRVGYFRVVCFQKTTATEMIAALDELSRLQMESLVVDLRQNPGGLLQEAIDVSNLFLDSGTIVRTRGRAGEHSYSATRTSCCATPLVLLVDENSASASEIFAGAMKENGRAVVVGTQSYGKGTVQAIVQLSCPTQTPKPIAGLRLTTEKFYSPNGFAYGGVGVLPHVRVELPENPQNPENPEAVASFAATNPTYSASTDEAAEFVELNASNEIDADPFLAAAVREANRLSSRRQSLRLSTRSENVAPPTPAPSRRAAPRFVGVSTERP
ncbi:MAG: S41 family peptidase, partial [Thermoguttaceae bacterium]|nr:S41 family peptidase [Thermoguttaceae bacterium]